MTVDSITDIKISRLETENQKLKMENEDLKGRIEALEKKVFGRVQEEDVSIDNFKDVMAQISARRSGRECEFDVKFKFPTRID